MTPSSDGGGDLTAAENPSPPSPPKSRHRLHNFSFPSLRWGTQRILRCKSPVTALKPQPKHYGDRQPSPAEAVTSPWNLRKRRFRSSCNEATKNFPSPPPPTPPPPEAPAAADKSEGARLLVSLSREEIVEDFLRMKGARPQRRPKKRARFVQKKLDRLFPGLWLDELTAESYKRDD